MADWLGAARTNYFPVKDPEAFRAWAEDTALTPVQAQGSDLLAFQADGCFEWPSGLWGFEDEPGDFDIVTELALHVVEGWPVVLIQAGVVTSVGGRAVAFRVEAGVIDRIELSLDDIYDIAAERWGVAPTHCS